MKRKHIFFMLLICFVTIFVTIFSFNIDVFAKEDDTTYYFKVSKSDFTTEKSLIKQLCGYSMMCRFHFKKAPIDKETEYYGYKSLASGGWTPSNDSCKEVGCIYDGDYGNVDMFSLYNVVGINAIKEALKSDKYAVCGDSGKESCYTYIGDNYCGTKESPFSKNDTEICKVLNEVAGKSSNDCVLGGKDCYSCTTPLTSYDLEGKIQNSITIRFEYDKKGNFRVLQVNNKTSSVGNCFKEDGDNNKYCLYPVDASSKKLDALKTAYVESGFNCSQKLGVFCLAKKKTNSNNLEWYLEVGKSECPKSKGYTGDSQGIGGSSVIVDTKNFSNNIAFIDNSDLVLCTNGYFFGDAEITKLVNTLINVVKVLIPVILLVLGSLDFGSAVFAQDEGNIKKAQTKFIKRLIIAVVIFLIPSILHAILVIASGVWDVIDPSLCGII